MDKRVIPLLLANIGQKMIFRDASGKESSLMLDRAVQADNMPGWQAWRFSFLGDDAKKMPDGIYNLRHLDFADLPLFSSAKSLTEHEIVVAVEM